MNNTNIYLSTAGTIYGISIVNIEHILGLVLTILNLSILVISLAIKIIDKYKNDGKLDKQEIDEILDDASRIGDQINGLKK